MTDLRVHGAGKQEIIGVTCSGKSFFTEPWKDEESDTIFVRIMRMKADGRSQDQMITLDEFKKMLVGE